MTAASTLTEEQIFKARAVIAHLVPEWAERKEVLDALFAPGRKTRYNSFPTVTSRARSAWLDKVRDWAEDNGLPTAGCRLRESVIAAYESATGDVWRPESEEASAVFLSDTDPNGAEPE